MKHFKMKKFLSLFLVLLLCFFAANSFAASDDILFRGYDIGKLNQGYVSVVLTSENDLNRGELGIEVGGVPLSVTENIQELSGKDFYYVLVVDLSAPYYSASQQRRAQHAQAMVSAVQEIISAANADAQFSFVWAGPDSGATGVMGRESAINEIQMQQAAIDANYKSKSMEADLNGALETAYSKVMENPSARAGKAASIVLVSDCAKNISGISDVFSNAGIPMHVWAIKHSKVTDQGSSESGRKTAQTESGQTGGQYEEWDIVNATDKNVSVDMGRIPSMIQRQEKGTRVFQAVFTPETWEIARTSRDQSIVIKYGGNAKASRIASDLRLSVLPTPTAEVVITPEPIKVITFGEVAPEVGELQEILRAKGYYDGPISSQYDMETRKALKEIYQDNGEKIPEDDFETWPVDLLQRLQNYAEKPTPKPETIDLKQGDTGEYVLKLEDKLYQMGFYHRLMRSNTNTYDANTQEAVNRFCTQSHMDTPDGCPKEVFDKILEADPNSVRYQKPQYVDLRIGESDPEGDTYVAELQNNLREKGYLSAGFVNSTLDDQTVQAIRDICAQNGWDYALDEIIPIELQKRIATADPKPTPTPAPEITPPPTVIELHMNDQNEYVEVLQIKLSSMGFYHRLAPYTPRLFDESTQEAVFRFCRQVLGQENPEEGCTKSCFQLILDSDVTYKKPQYVDLHPGDRDKDDDTYVAELQKLLQEKGYLTQNFTWGVLDSVTMEAVRAIRNEYHWPDPDDIVTDEEIRKILSLNPTATATPAPEFMTLEFGNEDLDDAEYIQKMQKRLKELGYFLDEEPNWGIYDEATKEAVKRFVTQNKLSGDGTTITAAQIEGELFGKELPYQKPIGDKVIDFFLGSVEILNLKVPVWAIGAVIIALIFAIIIVLIMAAHRNKQKKDSSIPDSTSHTPGTRKEKQKKSKSGGDEPPTIASSDNRGGINQYNNYTASGRSGETTYSTESPFTAPNAMGGAGMEEAPTQSEAFFAANMQSSNITTINFHIDYNGQSRDESITMMDKIRIGRQSSKCELALDPSDLTVSRVHCELRQAGEKIMVHNLSDSAAGTVLNGFRISATADFGGEDAATVSLDDFRSGEEVEIHSGDVLSIGRHTITVNF